MNNIKRKKRIAAVVCACTLTVALVIGGTTLAWLTDTTQTVTNTFTTSNIDITLTETKGDLERKGDVVTGSSFKMIPGYTIAKDPVVTVKAGSEDCWLFVKIEESVASDTTVKFSDYMMYSVADGWTQGDGTNIPKNVWYRKVPSEEIQKGDECYVLAGDGKDGSEYENGMVTVKDTVTKEMMAAAADKEPTLTFTAYASQLMKNNTTEFTAIEAWGNVPGK